MIAINAIEWENVDWSNTHMDVSLGQVHVGTINHSRMGRLIALAVGPDDARTQIILLSEDDVDELMRALRSEAKSL